MKMVYQLYTICRRSSQVCLIDELLLLDLIASHCFHSWYIWSTISDEWTNFLERLGCKDETAVLESDENILQLRHWVSLRGQTLFRTGTLYHTCLLILLYGFYLLLTAICILQLEAWCIIGGHWSFRLFLTWLLKKVRHGYLTCAEIQNTETVEINTFLNK